MNGNLNGFNAGDIEPQGSYDPVPADWYEAMIVASEFKPTKNGTGEYLQLELDVISGDYASRKLWARLNLNNQNATAVEIAQRELSSICRAVGVMTPNDSADLHDKPLRIKVTIRPAGNGYDASNEIKAYEPMDAATPASVAAPAATAERKPWQK